MTWIFSGDDATSVETVTDKQVQRIGVFLDDLFSILEKHNATMVEDSIQEDVAINMEGIVVSYIGDDHRVRLITPGGYLIGRLNKDV